MRVAFYMSLFVAAARAQSLSFAPQQPLSIADKAAQCGTNERFNECSSQGCEPRCDTGLEVMSCIMSCGPAKCECSPGYKRNASGQCVMPSECPKEPVVCGPVCMIWCEHGNKMNLDGCPICACNDAPAALTQPMCVYGPLRSGEGGVEVNGLIIPRDNVRSGCDIDGSGAVLQASSDDSFSVTLGSTTVQLATSAQSIRGGTSMVYASVLRAVPRFSCLAYGCDGNTWDAKEDGSSTCLLSFKLNDFSQQCFCDNACMQFSDCCEDYQETCLSGAPVGRR